jgi:hypothetical protein
LATTSADIGNVQFERLVIESGSNTFSLDLHARLTVIAGVGRLERDGLINELVSALGSGRAGVHLELRADTGTRYTIFRPVGGHHCVIDVDHEEDVTDAFRGEEGSVNLLERAGLNERTAKRQMRLTATDLATRSTQEDFILTLAHVDQGRLWDVAWKVKDRKERLDDVAAAAGSTGEDAEAYEEIERRHRSFEEAQEQHERVRHLWFMVGGIAAIGAVPAAMLFGTLAAVPFVLGAIATTVTSIVFWQRLEQARRHEQDALDDAGAQSYLNFQINRVNGLVASDQNRRQIMQAAEYHRAALVEWTLLAGDVPVDWALEHRREVRQAAADLRHSIGGVRNPMASTMSALEETTADVAHALTARLDEMCSFGEGGESFPVFLDDPFAHIESKAKPSLLELLVNASGRQQIIYLTEDVDVAEWARVESMTGEVAIIEPGVSADTPAGSKHVVA